MKHELGVDRVKVEMNIGPDVCVQGDRKQMEEIVLNLMVNACQAMPQGGILTIEGESRADGTRIHISDTGEGISRDRMKRIFDPFYTTKGERGTGLGLYITKQLVERNGGRISVCSQEGKGTVFTLEFKAES
jgi:signal transduction histidine kinase